MSTILGSTVDMAELTELAGRGLLTSRAHSNGELLIHNYTATCQYTRAWTPLLMACRGLITDLSGLIIARPFPKFFNHDEHEKYIGPLNWSQPITATKKLDGSLGVLYDVYDPKIATRGSFDSPQAKAANVIFREKGYHKGRFRDDLTYLFEIIYPENRIVVNYGERRDLVLLECIVTETGEHLSYSDLEDEATHIGCEVAELVDSSGWELLQATGENEEGFVVRFDDGTRVKIKFAEYVRLHRLLTGINARHIWEYFRDGRDWKELVEYVPDEFHQWVRGIVDGLQQSFWAECQRVDEAYRSCNTSAELSRKEVAAQFTKLPDLAPALFAMYDSRPIDKIVWQKLKPEPSLPFVANDE